MNEILAMHGSVFGRRNQQINSIHWFGVSMAAKMAVHAQSLQLDSVSR